MFIEFFSIDYFILLIVIGLLIFFSFSLLRKYEINKIKKILFLLSIINIGLFFIKILDNSTPLIYLTLNNLCAFSTFILPFAFIIKNKYLKDCILNLSLIGGLLAIIVPTGYFSSIFLFIRFYLEHFLLLIVPLFIYYFKIHTYHFKSFIFLPLYFLFVEFIIYLNDLVLIKLNIVEELDLIFYYNDSFLYGPYIKYGKPLKIITIVIPSFLKTNINGVYKTYIYLIFPTLIYLYPISFGYSKLMSLNYNK